MPIPPNMAKYVAELSCAWAGYLSARTMGTIDKGEELIF